MKAVAENPGDVIAMSDSEDVRRFSCNDGRSHYHSYLMPRPFLKQDKGLT